MNYCINTYFTLSPLLWDWRTSCSMMFSMSSPWRCMAKQFQAILWGVISPKLIVHKINICSCQINKFAWRTTIFLVEHLPQNLFDQFITGPINCSYGFWAIGNFSVLLIQQEFSCKIPQIKYYLLGEKTSILLEKPASLSPYKLTIK